METVYQTLQNTQMMQFMPEHGFLFTQILWCASVMSYLFLLPTFKCVFLHLNLHFKSVSIGLITIQTMPGY